MSILAIENNLNTLISHFTQEHLVWVGVTAGRLKSGYGYSSAICHNHVPFKMPQGLKQAHHVLDLAIEKCHRSKPFEKDKERLEYLFKMHEEMIDKEKNE